MRHHWSRSLLLACGLSCGAARRVPPLVVHPFGGCGLLPVAAHNLPPHPHHRRGAVFCTVAQEPPDAGTAPPGSAPILSINQALDFSLPYRVLAFYAIAPVADPDEAVEQHRRFLAEQRMVGRVYVCADGLNAQVSGTAASCEAYRTFAAAAFPSEQLLFKEDPIEELAFPKLRVKHKALVPGAAVDLNARGEDVAPERWAAMLADADAQPDAKPAVLDVRNSYEWDVGHFDGAARPALDQFAAFDASTYGLPSDPEARKATPVMMYCTGGIRCEYASAFQLEKPRLPQRLPPSAALPAIPSFR